MINKLVNKAKIVSPHMKGVINLHGDFNSFFWGQILQQIGKKYKAKIIGYTRSSRKSYILLNKCWITIQLNDTDSASCPSLKFDIIDTFLNNNSNSIVTDLTGLLFN